MAKVRILNTSPGAITLMAYDNDGQLLMETIRGANGVLPGEGLVEESLLDLLDKRKDRAVAAHFESGRLRVAKPNTVPVEQQMEPVPQQPQPETTPTPEVPAVPAAPAAEDDTVPGVTADTPPDAPWATGNS